MYIISFIYVIGKNVCKISFCVIIIRKFMIVSMLIIMKVCSNIVMFVGKI